MTIGTALVIIAILYLIDRHHLWKKAAVACLVAFAVAIVGFSGYYGWEKLQERRAARTSSDEYEISAADIADGLVDVPNWTIHSTPKGTQAMTWHMQFSILSTLIRGQKQMLGCGFGIPSA